jgi:hypothetical protein
MQDKVFFLSQVLLLLDVGAAPTAFCYQFKPTSDRLVLNCVFDSGCPVVFCRAADNSTFTGMGSRATFFYANF